MLYGKFSIAFRVVLPLGFFHSPLGHPRVTIVEQMEAGITSQLLRRTCLSLFLSHNALSKRLSLLYVSLSLYLCLAQQTAIISNVPAYCLVKASGFETVCEISPKSNQFELCDCLKHSSFCLCGLQVGLCNLPNTHCSDLMYQHGF